MANRVTLKVYRGDSDSGELVDYQIDLSEGASFRMRQRGIVEG